jgi:hypothetical protein
MHRGKVVKKVELPMQDKFRSLFACNEACIAIPPAYFICNKPLLTCYTALQTWYSRSKTRKSVMSKPNFDVFSPFM